MEVAAALLKHAKRYYVKNGVCTGSAENFLPVLASLRKLYGHTRAADFGPLSLKALQAAWVMENRAGVTSMIVSSPSDKSSAGQHPNSSSRRSFRRRDGRIKRMMTARQAYESWLLKMELIGGSACLVIFAVCFAVAVILIFNSRRKREN